MDTRIPDIGQDMDRHTPQDRGDTVVVRRGGGGLDFCRFLLSFFFYLAFSYPIFTLGFQKTPCFSRVKNTAFLMFFHSCLIFAYVGKCIHKEALCR